MCVYFLEFLKQNQDIIDHGDITGITGDLIEKQ
jgi:hypothetical protein